MLICRLSRGTVSSSVLIYTLRIGYLVYSWKERPLVTEYNQLLYSLLRGGIFGRRRSLLGLCVSYSAKAHREKLSCLFQCLAGRRCSYTLQLPHWPSQPYNQRERNDEPAKQSLKEHECPGRKGTHSLGYGDVPSPPPHMSARGKRINNIAGRVAEDIHTSNIVQ